MVVLQAKDASITAPQLSIAALPHVPNLEQELDVMVQAVQDLDASQPDIVIATCMALMARCTEIYLDLVRLEGEHRKAKFIRTMQLQKVMDLLDFQFKGASRLVEVARQELDTTR